VLADLRSVSTSSPGFGGGAAAARRRKASNGLVLRRRPQRARAAHPNQCRGRLLAEAHTPLVLELRYNVIRVYCNEADTLKATWNAGAAASYRMPFVDTPIQKWHAHPPYLVVKIRSPLIYERPSRRFPRPGP
jgi:hypothetical protein